MIDERPEHTTKQIETAEGSYTIQEPTGLTVRRWYCTSCRKIDTTTS